MKTFQSYSAFKASSQLTKITRESNKNFIIHPAYLRHMDALSYACDLTVFELHN